MFIWLNERLRKDDKGFTLIELMVVVLIIAILIAIAIPTFLGARRRAQNRQAQSNLRNGLTAEKTYYADAQHYTDDESAGGDLNSIESNLSWGEIQGKARGVVVEEIGAGAAGAEQGVVLASLSAAGVLFCIMDVAQNVSFRGETVAGTFYHKVDPGDEDSTCPDTGWVETTDGWS